jgi:hypothetical protein
MADLFFPFMSEDTDARRVATVDLKDLTRIGPQG